MRRWVRGTRWSLIPAALRVCEAAVGEKRRRSRITETLARWEEGGTRPGRWEEGDERTQVSLRLSRFLATARSLFSSF